MNKRSMNKQSMNKQSMQANTQSMQLQVKGNETSISLRIICDSGAIEVFAMHGRAGVSARAVKSSGEIGVLLAGNGLGVEAPPSVDLAVFPLAFPLAFPKGSQG